MPQSIRVNLVCPGMIDTPMHQRIRGELGDAIHDDVLLPNVHARRARPARGDRLFYTVSMLGRCQLRDRYHFDT
jgi:NAD(P)-dependent dehydrogenase (short-subunit alcohol dehydrogenase family)